MLILNALFHILHLSIILSSLTLFLFDNLIILHLCLQGVILFSWLVIGPIINKPGVCLLTEAHKKLGLSQQGEQPHSYIVYLIKKLGYKGNDYKKIDIITFVVFGLCTVFSLTRFVLEI